MKKVSFLILVLAVAFVALKFMSVSVKTENTMAVTAPIEAEPPQATLPAQEQLTRIEGKIKRGETLYDVFKKYGLDIAELYSITSASKEMYNLGKLIPAKDYIIEHDEENRIRHLTYNIDDDFTLEVNRTEEGFEAEKSSIPYETELVHVSGVIKDNLVSSMDNLMLALSLSDILAWDIDFTTDLRKGDSFKLVVEERRLGGEFKKYGNIICLEFTNNGVTHYAYRFVQDGRADYYDENGRSLRRSLLKAPLSYRRISSGYSKRRLHPILKVYRPHLGVDYAAPTGTPVSTVGDGTVIRSGYNGPNGRQVIVKHPAGYVTYYGHLHRIAKGVKRGAKVKQGQVIGYVGKTGRATGPHLDYRIKKNGRFINPLKLNLPRGKSVNEPLRAEFNELKNRMNERLASIELPAVALNKESKQQG